MAKNEVIKASPVIQMSNITTLLQRKAFNHLLAYAYDDLPNNDIFTVNLDSFCESLGFSLGNDINGRNGLYLKGIIEKLNSTIVRMNILGKDKDSKWSTEEYGVIPLLAGTVINLKKRTIKYSFSPLIKADLHNPKVYARIMLSMQNTFSSKYEIALYELGIDYLDEKRGVGETPWINIEEFRSLMGLTNEEYKEFKSFSRKIVRGPAASITKKTDIKITPRYDRKRNVKAIKFTIERNKSFQYLLPLPPIPTKEEITELEELGDSQELLNKICKYGIPEKKAKIYIEKDYDLALNAIEAVEEYIKENRSTIKRISALVNKALSEGWKLKSEYEKECDNKKKQDINILKKKEQEKEEIEKSREIYNEVIENEVFKIFNELPQDEKEQVIKEVGTLVPDILKQQFKKGGIIAPLIKKGTFIPYMRERYIGKEYDDFDKWNSR